MIGFSAWELSEDGQSIISPAQNEIRSVEDVEYLKWASIKGNKVKAYAAPTIPYTQLRAAAYPPMADYMDAVVKGDTVAQQAYIDACLAVKAKYPK